MTIAQDGVKLMQDKVYLACYHGKATKLWHRICDNITKFFTRGKYSHCEIVVFIGDEGYQCYSSSYRDGGVRTKVMQLDLGKWDLIPLNISIEHIQNNFDQTKGLGYDLLGALGCVAGLRQHPNKYFCSEWCFNAVHQSNQGWRFSPVQLYEIYSKKE